MQLDATRNGVKVGDLVGPYKLLRQIGAGATGQVFEVEHSVIGRRAALKVLYPDHALLPSAMRRLFAEAQAVNRINHPHIVEITDVVESDRNGSAAGVVMELLDGLSLAELIAGGKRVEPGRLPHIMGQVADALAAAHAAGFVHRDLKPENIFITARDGVRDYVKLLDFGLAKSLVVEESTVLPDSASGALAGRAHRTIEGTFLGTPAYASPEQAAGKTVDHRTDLYAFGVILYELLCGRLPFEGENLGEYLVKHITVMPPPVPDVIVQSDLGAGLAEVAMRCLKKNPAQRYASATEIKEELMALPPAPVGVARPRTALWQALSTGRRKATAIGLGAGAAALALVVTLLATSGSKPAVPAGQVAPGRRPAAAPVVTPIPAPTARRVTVTFQSRPAGAEVRRLGDPELLGITPFDESFVAADQTVDFEMRLGGHEPRRIQAHLNEDSTVTGQLRKRRAGSVGPQRNDQLRERTLDPWRN
jgi:tRNA A-37 threonylcarbamoyl transferase component Bud32